MERKLIVPNANLKLTLTFCNGIIARVGDTTFTQGENKLSLTGLIDTPVMIDPREDRRTGTIIVEFNQLGAYRFFRLCYAEIKNQIVEFDDLAGNQARELQSKLAEAGTLTMKLQIMQRFLIRLLERSHPDPVYDYCINRITSAKGLISVSRLEKETGYSSRWLQAKFSEHLGTGPKNLSEIMRFKEFYQAYSAGVKSQDLRAYIYHYYHDQSHCIRAFRRFTGSTMTELQNSMNELSIRNFKS